MLCENALSLWWHMALVFLLPSRGLKSWEWCRCYDGKQCSSGVAKLGVFWVRSEYVAGAF